MTFPSDFPSILRYIIDGENVDAETTNRPLQDLASRTGYLYDALSELAAGERLRYREVPIDEDVSVGNPVYLDSADGLFKKALVDVSFNDDNSSALSDSTYVWGVVTYKYNYKTADITTIGLVRDLDISSLVDEVRTGPYYLSSTVSGKMTTVRSPLAPLVMYYWEDQNLCLITAGMTSSIEDHVHYRFQLYAQPAGIPNNPVYGDIHEIVTPDASMQGWLPADHAIFSGAAPAGAKFGYNLSQHPELSAVFPPIPVTSAYVEVFGNDAGSSREMGESVVIDNNGIWWMTDNFGWAPWGIDYWEGGGSSVAASSDSDAPPPVELIETHGYDYDGVDDNSWYEMSIYLWFTRMTYKTSDAVVTSLSSCDGSPIRVLDCDCADEATAGNLKLALDLDFNSTTGETGAEVLKTIDGTTFGKGLVVEKIKSLDPTVITVTAQPILDSDGTNVAVDENGYARGTLAIGFSNPDTSGRELPISLLALNNVREEQLNDVLFLGFLPSRLSNVRGKVDVPYSGLEADVSYVMRIRMRILGTVASTLPDLTFSYRRIPTTDFATPTNLPTSEGGTSTIELSEAGYNSGAGTWGAGLSWQNQYVEVWSDPFTVIAGDTVFFTVERSSSDSYAGTVGLLRQSAIIDIAVDPEPEKNKVVPS